MKTMMFAVYDSKAEAYMQPIFLPTRAMAIRSFVTAALDANSTIGKYPSDFALFELGSFEDGLAVFSILQVPIMLGLAQDLMAAAAPSREV